MSLGRLASIPLLFLGATVGGINWKHVWLEPREMPVVVAAGETKPYTVLGIDGADGKAELTRSPYLKITSSNPEVLGLDSEHGVFIGKRTGHSDIRLSFSEATALVPAFVRAPKTASADTVAGVWKAVFTGDLGERPKMVSEIVFALDSTDDALTGTVHAAYWPGDGAVANGKVEGDRVSFTMTGKSPFQANGVTGYPKLCFSGVRHGHEMKIDLLWTEAGSPCESGKLRPMAGKKLSD
jgi:hypothetical protein